MKALQSVPSFVMFPIQFVGGLVIPALVQAAFVALVMLMPVDPPELLVWGTMVLSTAAGFWVMTRGWNENVMIISGYVYAPLMFMVTIYVSFAVWIGMGGDSF